MVTPLLQIAAQIVIMTVPPIPVTNLTGDGLRIDWSVEKAIGPSIDSAKVTVYNLDPTLRKAIATALTTKAWASPTGHGRPSTLPISLLVGWAGVPQLVFQGEAWQVTPDRHDGRDILTEIDAGDGGPALRDTPPSGGGTIVPVAAQIAVQYLLTQLGLTPSPQLLALVAERGASSQLPQSSYVWDGDPKDQLTDLMATLGLSWGIADGFVVAYQQGLRNDLPALQLSPEVGGLLSWDPLDDGGYRFEALTQPLSPGQQVLLFETLTPPVPISGPLRVQSMALDGSTEGQSVMSVTARRVEILG